MQTADGFLGVMQVKDPEYFSERLTGHGNLFALSSIIYAISAARLIVFWLLNVASLFLVGLGGYKIHIEKNYADT